MNATHVDFETKANSIVNSMLKQCRDPKDSIWFDRHRTLLPEIRSRFDGDAFTHSYLSWSIVLWRLSAIRNLKSPGFFRYLLRELRELLMWKFLTVPSDDDMQRFDRIASEMEEQA